MKNSILLASIFGLFIAVVACKKNETKSKTETTEVSNETKSEAAYSLKTAIHDINFIAYKTTAKVAVNGWFKKVDIVSGGEGATIKDAINNTQFSIPVTSIKTNDTSRDYKIRKFFFDVMVGTSAITGKFLIKDSSTGEVNLTMNGETKTVPFTYTISGNVFKMQSTIDINDWNAGSALASLNTVCKDLHTGADGVSKTWSEVALNITSTF